MATCCVCQTVASVQIAGAPVCGASHAETFYHSLRENDRAKVNAGQSLSELKVRYYSIGTAFDLDVRLIELNQKFKDYVRIGRGGNAQIFRAVSILNGKTYALKIFSPARSKISVQRDFVNLIELRHRIIDDFGDEEMLRNLPDVYDAFRANTPFHSQPSYVIKMEYVRGRTLDSYVSSAALERQKLDIDSWLNFALSAFHLLQTMHAVGMVHGDIKGENIMVRQTDEAFDLKNLDRNFVLIDFGLSCFDEACDDYVTGTVLFMGPDLIGYPFTREFARHLRDLPSNERLAMFQSEDVYALATTLFNALCAQSLSYLQQRAKEAMRIPEDAAFDPRNPQQVDKRNGLRRHAAVAVFIPPVFKKNFDWILERNERVKEHAALLFRIYAMTIASWSKTRAKAGDVMLAISDARRELQ